MSASKTSPALGPSDVPPPSYDESLTASQPANPIASRISTLISTHILPPLKANPTNTLVLVPFDVTPLFALPATEKCKDATAFAYPGEKLVGFDSDEDPLLIRLSDTEGGLHFWRTAAVLRELTAQLCREVSTRGYRVVTGGRSPMGLEWHSFHQATLMSGEARLHAEVKEVCLRVENAMGLYETRSGIAIVVKVELAYDENDDGGLRAGCL
ncbi:MAG: hypothetical protein L6R42_006922 [Xanthoria sp. 1 TBL-2021]|nr:MAG: hypothetical protein L6R42_006922 [Xanthoria sp. 1 TBL-2021]